MKTQLNESKVKNEPWSPISSSRSPRLSQLSPFWSSHPAAASSTGREKSDGERQDERHFVWFNTSSSAHNVLVWVKGDF